MPVQVRSQATFQALLDATIQVLVQEGYAAVTTNRVASVAGVSIGSLYEYFSGKKALIATALSREIDRLTQELLMDLRAALRADAGSAQAIDRLVRAFAQGLEKRKLVLRAAFHQVPFFWEIPKARHHTRRLLRIVRLVLMRAEANAPPQDLDERTWVLTSMIWFVMVQTAIHRPPALDRERVLVTITDSLVRLMDSHPAAGLASA